MTEKATGTEKQPSKKRSRKTKAWPHRVKRVRTADLAYVTKHHDDCELCRRDHTDQVLLDLLEARRPRTNPARSRAIAKVIEKHGLDLTLEQEMAHFRRHRAPQPTPRADRVGDQAELDAVRKVMEKDPKRQEIVKYIGRAGRVTADQIAELWFAHNANPPKGPRFQASKLFRNVLMPYHIVYQVHVGDNPQGYCRQIYGLGHGGAEWLSRATDRPWNWIPGPRKVGYETLTHDLEVNGLFNVLKLSAGHARVQIGGITTTVAIDNFYTAHDLFLGLNGQDKWFAGKIKRTIQPDAFCAVGIEMDTPPAGFPASSLNPLLLELDAGTKDERDVAAQIISHILLAQSQMVKHRFPELKGTPKEYAVPVMMTFEHLSDKRVLATRRIKRIFGYAREQFNEQGLWLRLPFWGLHKADWDKHQLQAPTFSLWADDQQFNADLEEGQPAVPIQTGFSRLLASNRLLHQQLGLPADHILTFDPDGGGWDGPEHVVNARKRRQKTTDEIADAAAQVLKEAKAVTQSQAAPEPTLTGGVGR